MLDPRLDLNVPGPPANGAPEYMSRTTSSRPLPGPLALIAVSNAKCGIALNAFDTSNQATHLSDLMDLALSSTRLRVWTCSNAPSDGRKTFWHGLNTLLSVSHFVRRAATQPTYSLRTISDLFQTGSTRLCFRQMLRISVRTLQLIELFPVVHG